MGGIPVVEVTRGGIPVTESDRGVPYEIAANGMGVPVRFVSSGGAPFKGAPYRIVVAGAVYERRQDVLTREFILDILTGQPIYDEVR